MLSTLLVALFCIAYAVIAFEHRLHINKAATALIAGAACWGILAAMSGSHTVIEALTEHTSGIAGIVFFIMGAMTIVEVIDDRGGFVALKRIFEGSGYTRLIWLLTGITFVLSAVLDNLTTAILMTSVIVKLVEAKHARMLLAGLVIITANAGGAWSPIGDVTTTMLWVGNRISAAGIMAHLILPSLISALIPAILVSVILRKEMPLTTSTTDSNQEQGNTPVLLWGIALLVSVPITKTLLHIPPYVAMLAALGVLWAISDIRAHHTRRHEAKPVVSALGRIDLASAMFFLGILLSVAALDSAGILRTAAEWMQVHVPDERIVASIIGIASAIIDNVPLVAGAIGMYDPASYPLDHRFWIYLAYCGGTGGSILVIGSAAGVAAMGIAKLEFSWYMRVVGPIAAAGYGAGLTALIIQERILSWLIH